MQRSGAAIKIALEKAALLKASLIFLSEIAHNITFESWRSRGTVMKNISKSTRAKAPTMLVKLIVDGDGFSVHRINPEHARFPGLISRQGSIEARFSGGVWHEVENGQNTPVTNQQRIDELEAVGLAVSYPPHFVSRERNPDTKARLAHNAGIYLHECEAWEVDPARVTELALKYGDSTCPVPNGFRPISTEDKMRANSAMVGPGGMTYGEWKGEIGPGAIVREIARALKGPTV